MAGALGSIASLVARLRGISTFTPPPMPGLALSDETLREARRAMGGNLEPIPSSRLRWYPPDIERAQASARDGDLTTIGQLSESMNLDGVIRGLTDARTSVVNFPRRLFGSAEVVEVLQARLSSDRSVYDEMIPATEARLMVGDGIKCGVAVGEMVPVQGRSFPVLVRRYPQNLLYLWSRDQWYYRSIAGNIPIRPGEPDADGNLWVLHLPGGRLAPWNSGLWNTLGRSYINKTQSVFARQAYEMRHSQPARVATGALGATEEERKGMIQWLIRWAMNAAVVLPMGWDLKLVESNGQGIKVYNEAIATADKEIATALCGSATMLEGTVGFGNIDVFKVVTDDLIKSTADAWMHTVNTQILPPFIGLRWGVDALDNATTVEIDVKKPSDKTAEATSMVTLANALKGLVEAIASAQNAAGETTPITVDVKELLAGFGVPTVLALVTENKIPDIRLELAPTDVAKVVRVDEARASQGLPPIGDERGQLTIAELDALSKAPPANDGAPAPAPADVAAE